MDCLQYTATSPSDCYSRLFTMMQLEFDDLLILDTDYNHQKSRVSNSKGWGYSGMDLGNTLKGHGDNPYFFVILIYLRPS